jgi:FemAB-related protein (PEP-CTERM system-associated)
MSVRIRDYRQEEAPEWDAFVGAHRLGTPFHLTAWRKTIAEVYGFEPRYLVAETDGAMAGVLPLFAVKNPLMGRVLLSSPFAVYGGVLASSQEAQRALGDAVAVMGRRERVDYVELRNAWPEQGVGFEPLSRYVTFTQQIGPDEPAILEAIPRKTRYMVRKALKHAYSSRKTRELGVFWDQYSKSLRRLGTPCFPRRYFEALLANFGDRIEIHEVLLEGEPVAVAMSFLFGDRILPYYGASDPSRNDYAPNNYMYFDLMRWAGGQGYREFDFGRSKKESGSFDFKAHWGMQMRDLPYEMLLVNRKELPNFSPNNPKFQWAIRAWQKAPLPLTRAIGPWLVKLVP